MHVSISFGFVCFAAAFLDFPLAIVYHTCRERRRILQQREMRADVGELLAPIPAPSHDPLIARPVTHGGSSLQPPRRPHRCSHRHCTAAHAAAHICVRTVAHCPTDIDHVGNVPTQAASAPSSSAALALLRSLAMPLSSCANTDSVVPCTFCGPSSVATRASDAVSERNKRIWRDHAARRCHRVRSRDICS